jgi:hypothetical protein
MFGIFQKARDGTQSLRALPIIHIGGIRCGGLRIEHVSPENLSGSLGFLGVLEELFRCDRRCPSYGS